MRDAFVNTLLRIMQNDKSVIMLTADLGFGVLAPLWEAIPDRIINVGIAEQAMTGIAAGMAAEGKTIFTYSSCNFPSMRCLEQIRMDCAYHDLNVKIVGTGCGLSFGNLGVSHHAIEDIAITRAIPNMVVAVPADQEEAAAMTNAIYLHYGPAYLRLDRDGEPAIHEKLGALPLGKSLKVLEGEDIAIFTAGSIMDEVIKARNRLSNAGLSVAVYSFPTVKPIDKETIIDCVKRYQYIFTVEEHNVVGGFGSAVAEVLAQSDRTAKLEIIGINDMFSHIAGSQQFLREYYGIDAYSISERILSCVSGR